MAKCCWYGAPTLINMARYACKRVQHFGNRDADVEGLLPLLYPETHAQSSATGFPDPLSAGQALKGK